jgi:hypothetical protein
MKITRKNYEIYFLDFYDGTLKSENTAELHRFLELNPDLKEEFDGFENIEIQPETIYFSDKQNLKKITEEKYFDISDFEYLCIADIEKDISKEQKSELTRKIKISKENEEVYKTIVKTKLKPDLSIKYSLKNRIKRFTIGFNKNLVYKISAAAVLLIFIGISTFVFYSGLNRNQNYSANILQSKTDINSFLVRKSGIKILKKSNIRAQPIKQTIIIDSSDFVNNAIPNSDSILEMASIEFPNRAEKIASFPSFTFQKQNSNRHVSKEKSRKTLFWTVAEKTVEICSFATTGNLKMKNQYNAYGKIEKLNLYSANFKFSKSYKSF